MNNTNTPEQTALNDVERIELQDLRVMYKSLCQYIGNPAWKVLQEYRQLVLSLSPGANDCLFHFHNIDSYLTKLVDEMNKLRKYSIDDRGHFWDQERLPDAKGDYLLEEIAARHPNFINWESRFGNNDPGGI